MSGHSNNSPGNMSLEHYYDAIIIGAGAGGSVAAFELSKRNQSVLLIEEGPWFNSSDFNGDYSNTIKSPMRNFGMTPTLGLGRDPSMLIPQAKAVGGSTVINGGTCYRTPDDVLNHWSTSLGLSEFSPQHMSLFFDEVERELQIKEVAHDHLGRNNTLIVDGAKKLGYSYHYVKRNESGCKGASECITGCPRDAKLATHLTYIPWAIKNGATLVTDTKIDAIEHSNGTAHGIRINNKRIKAKRIFVACGAIYSPLLLKKSGIHTWTAGKGLYLHPASKIIAQFKDPIQMPNGILQGVCVDEFLSYGTRILTTSLHPTLVGLTLPGTGSAYWDTLNAYPFIAANAVMVEDDIPGRVLGQLGNMPLIHYGLTRNVMDRLIFSFKKMAEIYFSMNATKIWFPIHGLAPFKSMDDVRSFSLSFNKRSLLELLSLHPMGTAPLGKLTNNTGKLNGFNNLYISDASLIPTPIGVNLQVTIMAMVKSIISNIFHT